MFGDLDWPLIPSRGLSAIAEFLVNIWNSLPNTVVDVDTVKLFKSRLDKFWMHQEVKYDYIAELTGTGNWSKYYN